MSTIQELYTDEATLKLSPWQKKKTKKKERKKEKSLVPGSTEKCAMMERFGEPM